MTIPLSPRLPIAVSVNEAAALLGVSPNTILRHAPLRKIGRRTLVPMSWVRGYSEDDEGVWDRLTEPAEVRTPSGTMGVPQERRRPPQDRDLPGEADPRATEGSGPLVVEVLHTYRPRKRRRVPGEVAA